MSRCRLKLVGATVHVHELDNVSLGVVFLGEQRKLEVFSSNLSVLLEGIGFGIEASTENLE